MCVMVQLNFQENGILMQFYTSLCHHKDLTSNVTISKLKVDNRDPNGLRMGGSQWPQMILIIGDGFNGIVVTILVEESQMLIRYRLIDGDHLSVTWVKLLKIVTSTNLIPCNADPNKDKPYYSGHMMLFILCQNRNHYHRVYFMF
jgi:hypothetical protein